MLGFKFANSCGWISRYWRSQTAGSATSTCNTTVNGVNGNVDRSPRNGSTAYEKLTRPTQGQKEFQIKRAMIRKRHPPKEIVARLREVDEALARIKLIATSPQASHFVTITRVNISRMNLKMSCNLELTIRMIRAAMLVQRH